MNVEASQLEHEVTQNNNSFCMKETGEVLVYVNESIKGGSGNGTDPGILVERILTIAIKARDENSEVGLLLSSKAFVQLVANPIVGVLCSRFGYAKMLVFGSLVLFVSAITFTFSETYAPLLVARALQGIASAATTIAGMSMIAERYPDDKERSRAMGTAMSGLAVGILVGYPFGGILYAVFGKDIPFAILACFILINIGLQTAFLEDTVGNVKLAKPSSITRLLLDPYIDICAGAIMFTSMSLAVLESTVPIWIMDTMHADNLQLGLVFLPDSIGYLVGTYCFPVLAKTYGRWVFTVGSLCLIALGLVTLPFCSSFYHLAVPHLCLGLGVGITDAAIMPLLALLVDQRHVAAYGSVYAIVQLAVCLAYGLGPAIAGQIVKNAGFEWSMWGMAFINVAFAPLIFILKNPNIQEEHKPILPDTDSDTKSDCDLEDTQEFLLGSYSTFKQN
ncbi:hypothetical protein ACJMK2_006364 [Sinanodonta woodiana]|uniref:Major facilitator superfamily (MFS) profile domain-containing protein n=1 Tax=Sinanodonta woodiana TaxID=1069815 RepID=A0ABD3VTM8_SINWO